MTVSLKKMLWATACLAFTTQPLWGQQSTQSVFDVNSFLEACTDHVPDVAFAIPMDGECISQAQKMCDLATQNASPGKCLAEVTEWMQVDTAEGWRLMPEEEPIAADESPRGPDCKTLDVEGGSTESLCDYTEALSVWHAMRITERANPSATSRGE